MISTRASHKQATVNLISPESVKVTVAQSAKYKVCCLWHNVFHFDRSMHDKLFLTVSVFSSFSFSIYIFCH